MKRIIINLFIGSVLFAISASAGVLDTIGDFTGAIADEQGIVIALVTAALLAIFRWIPNESIQLVVGKTARGLGVACTLFLSRAKITLGLWNKVIEPFFIDLLENTVETFIREFIAGLRHDNVDTDEKK